MKERLRLIKRLAVIVLSVCLLLPCAVVSAMNTLSVVFMGNTTLPMQSIAVTYPYQVEPYLKECYADYEIKVYSEQPLDLNADNFLQVISENVLSKSPDMIFIELNISKNYKNTEEELTAKLEAAVRALTDNKKVPSVYFIYTPDESFLDAREPFERVAEHYDITVCDAFKSLKLRWNNGTLKKSQFLTAGMIPSEEGHTYIAEAVTNALKGVDDLLKKPNTDKKNLTNFSVYFNNKTQSTEQPPTEATLEPAELGEIIYVAKNGSDGAKGTKESPLASLNGAKNKIRILKREQGKSFKGATVYIREGLYQVDDGFYLGAEDSGAENGKIIYSAYPGEKVRLTNAEILSPSDFYPVTDAKILARIPEEAHGKVLQYSLREHGISPGTYIRYSSTGEKGNYFGTQRNYRLGNILQVEGKNEQRATYPNGGYARVAEHQSASTNQVAYDMPRVENWITAKDAFLTGMMGEGYYTEEIRVKSIDTENRFINLYNNALAGVRVNYPWNMTNLLEELDIPSEWYADESENILYYYPRKNIKECEILFSSRITPIVQIERASHITLKDISFEASCGEAVKIIDGSYNIIDTCEMKNLGYGAVYITNNGTSGAGNNGVINSHIHDTAMIGVYIEGGDREGLTEQNDYIKNCHFENFSTVTHSETGAVATDGSVLVTVEHCNIHNDDSPALFMGGNEDTYIYNELYNIAKDTDDYGAIYGDARGAMRQGVNMHHNYMHDVVYNADIGTTGAVMGFYSDAARNWGARIYNNVFRNVRCSIYLADNRNMYMKQNLIMDDAGPEAIHTSYNTELEIIEPIYEKIENARDMEELKEVITENSVYEVLFGRAYLSSPEFTTKTEKNYYLKYPWLEPLLYSDPVQPRNMSVIENAILSAGGNAIDFGERINNTTVRDNNYLSLQPVESLDGDQEKRVDLGMKRAAEKIEGFEVWDVRKAGLLSAPTPIKDFEIIAPQSGSKDVDVSTLVLRWDYASGADSYRVVIAADKEFKNIVFDKSTVRNYIAAEGLEYGVKTYYWYVEASSYSHKFTGTPQNLGGVHSFTSLKTEYGNPTALGDTIKEVKLISETITDGTEGGQYPEGTKEEFISVIAEAEEVFVSSRSDKKMLDDMEEKLIDTKTKLLSRANLAEVDLSEAFANQNELSFVAESGIKLPFSEKPNVSFNGNGLSFSSNGTIYTNAKLNPYDVARFTAKFDFGGNESPAVYTMLALRTQEQKGYLFSTKDYAFLVTKNNIELQGFKHPGNEGKFYMTVPNTFIEEGKEHNIEFCAIPAEEGSAVRIILMIDGQIVYDYTDKENIIGVGGFAAINNSARDCTFTISPAVDTDYPTIKELLADPDSVLNKPKE